MSEYLPRRSPLKGLLLVLLILVGAAFMAGLAFYLLVFIQKISDAPPPEREIVAADAFEEPPPPKIEEEPPPEKEEVEEVESVDIDLEPQPISFDQLDISGTGGGGGWRGGNLIKSLDIKKKVGEDTGLDLAVNQKPRAIYQAQPSVSKALKKQAPATVVVAFLVDEKGRVKRPKVKSSTNSAFDRAAVAALKKWKFQPGKRGGKVATYRMKIPITFPRG